MSEFYSKDDDSRVSKENSIGESNYNGAHTDGSEWKKGEEDSVESRLRRTEIIK